MFCIKPALGWRAMADCESIIQLVMSYDGRSGNECAALQIVGLIKGFWV
jgi:hypothetical protein